MSLQDLPPNSLIRNPHFNQIPRKFRPSLRPVGLEKCSLTCSRRCVGYTRPWNVNHNCDYLAEKYTNTQDVVALASPGTPRQFLSLLTNMYFIPRFLHAGVVHVGNQTILFVRVHGCLATSLTSTHQTPTDTYSTFSLSPPKTNPRH